MVLVAVIVPSSLLFLVHDALDKDLVVDMLLHSKYQYLQQDEFKDFLQNVFFSFTLQSDRLLEAITNVRYRMPDGAYI